MNVLSEYTYIHTFTYQKTLLHTLLLFLKLLKAFSVSLNQNYSWKRALRFNKRNLCLTNKELGQARKAYSN